MKRIFKISALLLTTCTIALGAVACGDTAKERGRTNNDTEIQTRYHDHKDGFPDCPDCPGCPDCPDCPDLPNYPVPHKRSNLPFPRSANERVKKYPLPYRPGRPMPIPEDPEPDDGEQTGLPREDENLPPARPVPLPAN